MPPKTAPNKSTAARIAALATSTDPKIRAEAKRLDAEFKVEAEADAELDRRMGVAAVAKPHRDGRTVVCPVMKREDAQKFLDEKKKSLGFRGV